MPPKKGGRGGPRDASFTGGGGKKTKGPRSIHGSKEAVKEYMRQQKAKSRGQDKEPEERELKDRLEIHFIRGFGFNLLAQAEWF
jgi:hypothetical protein